MFKLCALLFIAWNFFVQDQASLPSDLSIIKNYDLGLAEAKKTNRPIFLLFTGTQCSNNKKVQDLILQNPSIQKTLKENYVTIWLYVDDPTPLAEPIWTEHEGRNVQLRTYGERWAMLEMQQFGCNMQPYAILLNHEGEKLQAAKSYAYLKEHFQEYLLEGLN